MSILKLSFNSYFINSDRAAVMFGLKRLISLTVIKQYDKKIVKQFLVLEFVNISETFELRFFFFFF